MAGSIDFNEFISRLREWKSLIGKEQEINEKLNSLCSAAKVPILEKSEDLPFDDEDFTSHKNMCSLYFENIYAILNVVSDKLEAAASFTAPVSLASLLIVVCGQHCDKTSPWSNDISASYACRTLELILKPNSTRKNISLIHVLLNKEYDDCCKNDSKNSTQYQFSVILKHLLQYLSDHFTKSNWKNDPGMQKFYLWLFYNLSPEDVCANLGHFLPGAFFMLDDWELRHKITALEVLQYILKHVPGSELNMCGRASVIYDAAKHQLYSRDYIQLEKAYPVVIKAAEVLQDDQYSKHSIEISKPEEVLNQLLSEMCYEQQIDRRRVYASSLCHAIKAAKLLAIRWNKEILEVFENYLLTFVDEEARDILKVLQAVQCYLVECWCQSDIFAEDILSIIVKLVVDCEPNCPLNPLLPDARALVLKECETVVMMVQSATPHTYRKLCQGLDEAPVPEHVLQRVNKVFQCTVNC